MKKKNRKFADTMYRIDKTFAGNHRPTMWAVEVRFPVVELITDRPGGGGEGKPDGKINTF